MLLLILEVFFIQFLERRILKNPKIIARKTLGKTNKRKLYRQILAKRSLSQEKFIYKIFKRINISEAKTDIFKRLRMIYHHQLVAEVSEAD